VRRALIVLLLPFYSACNSTDSGTIQILVGEETDTFTQTPVPATIEVIAVDSSNNQTTLATASYPTSSIDLGLQSENTVATLEVEALDATGHEVVFGSSIPVEYGALSGSTLPIFVQRVGQNARVPNPLADARQAPTVATISGRFLVVAGGSDSTLSSTTNVYDFAQFDELSGPPTLPRVPYSMPILELEGEDPIGLLIDPNGATYYDFAQDQGNDTSPPDTTFAFGDVAGGQTIYDSTDSWVFVVGGTRTSGNPTAAVLWIDMTDTSNSSYPTGNLHWLSLSAQRLGASAAWVTNEGLVVGGGSASAPGVEMLHYPITAQTTGAPLSFPPDSSVGSGMTWLAGTTMLMAGGVLASGLDAGVRQFDFTCAGTSCAPTVWSPLPRPLTLSSVFAINNPSQAFLVGSELASCSDPKCTPGLTHTYLLTTTGANEVPTKVTHTNAVGYYSPVGSVLVVGGNDAGEFESFIPAPITGYTPEPDAGTGDAASD